MPYFTHMHCIACGQKHEPNPVAICDYCFGPLEIVYDYERLRADLIRACLSERPFSMWRYRELLPVSGNPRSGIDAGGTPLLRAARLAHHWGLRELFIKNDAVNCPTLSFKDRVVSVAITAALEFGFDAVACASTGNLANSVAAQAAAAGLTSYIFIPHDLESAKIAATRCYGPALIRVDGTYDEVNRLCSEIAFDSGWGFVNVNLRAFYAEGSKTMGFEIAEQLGWRIPDAIVVPMAGGSLITKIRKAFFELTEIGFCAAHHCKIFGAQASGCNPITEAVKQDRNEIIPQLPNTIAKSLAIGNPADGYYAAKTIRESGGWGEDVTDDEIRAGIALLARTEGIFTETAGGVTIAVAEKLIAQGRIQPDELTVLCITGNGLKTQEVLTPPEQNLPVIPPQLDAFHDLCRTYQLTGKTTN